MFPYQPMFRDDNQFHFVCPIFKAETPIKSCLELRERYWAGEKDGVRQGCRACMMSNKCPINNIIRESDHWDKENRTYFSQEKVIGRLKQDHLERIDLILTTETTLGRFNLNDRELKLIHQSNNDAGKGIKPKLANPRDQFVSPGNEPLPSKAQTVGGNQKPLIGGDFADAINQAMESKNV